MGSGGQGDGTGSVGGGCGDGVERRNVPAKENKKERGFFLSLFFRLPANGLVFPSQERDRDAACEVADQLTLAMVFSMLFQCLEVILRSWCGTVRPMLSAVSVSLNFDKKWISSSYYVACVLSLFLSGRCRWVSYGVEGVFFISPRSAIRRHLCPRCGIKTVLK